MYIAQSPEFASLENKAQQTNNFLWRLCPMLHWTFREVPFKETTKTNKQHPLDNWKTPRPHLRAKLYNGVETLRC